MCELGPIVMANDSSSCQSSSQNFSDVRMPILTVTQQGRLEKLLTKFEEAVNRNEVCQFI